MTKYDITLRPIHYACVSGGKDSRIRPVLRKPRLQFGADGTANRCGRAGL